MKKFSHFALTLTLTLALAACEGKKGADSYGGGSGDGGLPSDQLNLSGIPPAPRPDGFNPDANVDYQTLASDTIYFAFDSYTIPASERPKMEQIRQWLVSNSDHRLFLAGHADKRGTAEYNRALGEKRAEAVREYLVGLGANANSLLTISYGSDRPAVEGDTEEAYAKNRRVEVGVVQQP